VSIAGHRLNICVEISSQVENGLFTVTGVGLIPWRAKDTYRQSCEEVVLVQN
jgi:hypothetical protein